MPSCAVVVDVVCGDTIIAPYCLDGVIVDAAVVAGDGLNVGAAVVVDGPGVVVTDDSVVVYRQPCRHCFSH